MSYSVLFVRMRPCYQGSCICHRIILIGTDDLQGRLDASLKSVQITEQGAKVEVMGGISRIFTLIKQIQDQIVTPVIVVSSGDDLMGKYFFLSPVAKSSLPLWRNNFRRGKVGIPPLRTIVLAEKQYPTIAGMGRLLYHRYGVVELCWF